jgi:hypothetical protein
LRVGNEVGQADEFTLLAFHRLLQDGQQRKRQERNERQRHDGQRSVGDAVGPVRLRCATGAPVAAAAAVMIRTP